MSEAVQPNEDAASHHAAVIPRGQDAEAPASVSTMLGRVTAGRGGVQAFKPIPEREGPGWHGRIGMEASGAGSPVTARV